MKFTSNTPWGKADHVEEVGSTGIKFVSTPGHGGVFVPDELMAKIPAELRGLNTYSGQRNWFEEDVEWAIPVLAFPYAFPANYADAAVKVINGYAGKQPGEYMYSAARWLASPAGDMVKARAKASTDAETKKVLDF